MILIITGLRDGPPNPTFLLIGSGEDLVGLVPSSTDKVLQHEKQNIKELNNKLQS